MRTDFEDLKPIKKMSFLRSWFTCRRTKYQKLLNKSKSSFDKEMDLRKFIQRQRVQTWAILGLLTGK